MSLTQEQADARSKGIGGSEAAAVCGISPWRTPVQLYQHKRKEVPEPDLSDNELVLWGELLEEVIGKEWGRRKKETVHRVRSTIVDKQHPFMLANIDFRVVGKREGLEVKNASQWTNEKWGELGSDDVPLYYLMQGVHYMRVLDYDAWNYAVLLGGNELLSYRVTRDDDIEKRLISIEGNFWRCVEQGQMPPPVRVDDLTRIWKKTVGRVQATPEIRALVERAREIKALVKPLVDVELEAIKLEVGKYMGEAGDLFDCDDPTLLQATYRAHDETRVNVDLVKKQLAPRMIQLMRAALEAGSAVDFDRVSGPADAVDVAMLKQIGPQKTAELAVASFFKTSPVRKFLPK